MRAEDTVRHACQGLAVIKMQCSGVWFQPCDEDHTRQTGASHRHVSPMRHWVQGQALRCVGRYCSCCRTGNYVAMFSAICNVHKGIAKVVEVWR